MILSNVFVYSMSTTTHSYDFLYNNFCTTIAIVKRKMNEKKLSMKRGELFSSKDSSSNACISIVFDILRMTRLW